MQHILSIIESGCIKDRLELAKIYGNYSEMLRYNGHLEEALEYGLKSLEIWINDPTADDSDRVRSLSNIGLLYTQLNDYGSAETYFTRAIQLIQERPIPPGTVITTFVNHSLLKMMQGKNEESLQILSTSLGMAERLYQPNSIYIAKICGLMCNVECIMKDYDMSLEYGRKSLNIKEIYYGRDSEEIQKMIRILDTIEQ